MSLGVELLDPATSTCNDSAQIDVINVFMARAFNANSTSSDDHIAEAKIGSYFQQAASDLKKLQGAKIASINNTPLFLQNCEGFGQRLEKANEVYDECAELLD